MAQKEETECCTSTCKSLLRGKMITLLSFPVLLIPLAKKYEPGKSQKERKGPFPPSLFFSKLNMNVNYFCLLRRRRHLARHRCRPHGPRRCECPAAVVAVVAAAAVAVVVAVAVAAPGRSAPASGTFPALAGTGHVCGPERQSRN